MYSMAHKAREAMKGKAKRLAGEKDQKVDSSNWTPAEPLNADTQTGMRPISQRQFKKGGKVTGAKGHVHAGRKPRKSGGRALTADSLMNRDQKEANAERPGKKHVGALKTGGRAHRDMGGGMTGGIIKPYMDAMMHGLKSGGRAKRTFGGPGMPPAAGAGPDPRMLAILKAKAAATKGMPSAKGMPAMPARGMPAPTPMAMPRPAAPGMPPMKKGGRAHHKDGGNVHYGPQEDEAGKKAPSTKQQIATEKHDQNLSKPSRAKARHYDYGGIVPAAQAPMPNVNSPAFLKFTGSQATPNLKKGGKVGKWEGSAKDEREDHKLAKKHHMSMKAWESSKMDAKHDKQESMKGLKKGGRTSKNVGGMSGAAGQDDGGDSYNPSYLGSAQSEAPFKDTSAGAEMREAGEEAGRRMKGRTLMRGAPEDMAQPRKGGGRTAKFGGGALSEGKAPKGKGKGKGTHINIMINPKSADAGMPGMPPGMPGMPPAGGPPAGGGVPVPMGMPPMGGGMPMGGAPMGAPPMPPAGGMPPMPRKAGGKVYRSYKDMDAGAGSGLGRIEKTEIQKRRG